MKFLLLATLLTSCASNSVLLKNKDLIPYGESQKITRLKGQFNSIALGSVTDGTNSKEIGTAFSGASYTPVKVYLHGESKVGYIKNYISDALSNRNILIFNQEDSHQLSLDIVINKFWVEEVIEKFKPERAKCVVDLSFSIVGENKSWKGTVWGNFLSPGDLSDGTTRLGPTLASCMNEVVEKLVHDKKFISNIR